PEDERRTGPPIERRRSCVHCTAEPGERAVSGGAGAGPPDARREVRRLRLGGTAAAVAVPLGVVAIIMLLVVPVPSWVLDLLITVNILLPLVILLTTLFASRHLAFSVFP